MASITIVLLAMIVLIGLLTLSGIYAEDVVAHIRRRVPNASIEGDIFVMWGFVLLAAFATGLVVMYLLLKP